MIGSVERPTGRSKSDEGKDRKYTVCPPEGESHCCICIKGQEDESQRSDRQAEKAEQLSRRS